jgi:membrane protease subunit HflK
MFKKENSDNPKTNVKISKALILPVVIVVLALLIISNGMFTVSEQEQAVVTMFGKVIDTKSAGLYFKIPFLQSVHKVSTVTKGIAVGYQKSAERVDDSENPADEPYDESESLMITSDFNFVNIDFYIEYRVSDPVKYLYTASNPEVIFRNLARASIRSTVVNYKVDDVITTGKSKIQAEVKDKLTRELQKQDIGLTVVNASIQDAEPPTNDVKAAFKAVETAKQEADTAINNAKAYQSEQLPKAAASADKIIKDAEAKKESRIAEAEGQLSRFNDTYKEYKNYPLITKKRMFYETLEDVLPELKVIITDGNTQTLYPIEKFSEGVKEDLSAVKESSDSVKNNTKGDSSDK